MHRRTIAIPSLLSLLFWFSILAGAGSLAGCGAAMAPPATGEFGYSASKAFDKGVEVSASRINGGAWQATSHINVAKDTVADVHVLLNDVPGDEYGFLMGGAGLRHRLGQSGDPVRLTLGFGAAGGVGGRYPAWKEDDNRTPEVYAGYIDVGAVIATPWDWLTVFVEGRAQRGWAPGRNAEHKPPTTDWMQGGGGARVDYAGFFGVIHGGAANFSNYHADDSMRLVGLTLGYRFGADEPSAKTAE